MKKITTLLALSLVAVGAAFAESPTIDDSATQVFSTTKTRAQVQAELVQARKDGSIRYHSTSYNPLAEAKSVKSREQVVAEVLARRDADTATQFYGEDSGSFYLARIKPAREAGPVLAGTPRTAQ